ncbi:conserved hypothetical protein, partial [Trichinella spiralis]|uniref:hypothetical protein n=1 Tax=Trichinella spiralis TaxID=6334 RepID=UPI0001EFD673
AKEEDEEEDEEEEEDVDDYDDDGDELLNRRQDRPASGLLLSNYDAAAPHPASADTHPLMAAFMHSQQHHHYLQNQHYHSVNVLDSLSSFSAKQRRIVAESNKMPGLSEDQRETPAEGHSG